MRPARPRDLAFGAAWVVATLVADPGGVAFYVFLALGVLTILRGLTAVERPVPAGESPEAAADRVTRLAHESMAAEVGEREQVPFEVSPESSHGVPDDVPVRPEPPSGTPVPEPVAPPREVAADVWVPLPGELLAPNDLRDQAPTPPGTPEGWYRTADGVLERWHNGASWTAHERRPGAR